MPPSFETVRSLPMRKAVTTILNFLAFAVLAWVLAHWFWQWVTPRVSVSRPSVPQDNWAAAINDAQWFAQTTAPRDSPIPRPSNEHKLLGTFAYGKGQGLALFADGGGKLVAAGKELERGVILRRVESNEVVIDNQGQEQRIQLRTVAPLEAITSARCALNKSERAQAYLLHSELLQGLAHNSEVWRSLFKSAEAALVVQDDTSFTRLLGLVRGDRLEQANGVQLAATDDVQRFILQPLTQNQVVRISGTRGGNAKRWIYVNATLCTRS